MVLLWRTGSEVDNLGFHVYRSLSAGRSLDAAHVVAHPRARASRRRGRATPGATRASRTARATSTVSRTWTRSPSPPSTAPSPPCPRRRPRLRLPSGGGSGGGGRAPAAARSLVLPGLGSRPARLVGLLHLRDPRRPRGTSFRVLSRTSRSVLVELETGGFLTARDATGRVRALLPGFDSLSDPLAPALPLKRARLDGVVGRQARIGSIQARENRFFPGLLAAAVGYPQAVVAPRRHRAAGPPRGRARPLPRRLPPRPGPSRRRGLPGRGQDPRPRAPAPALRRLARRARPLPTAHRPGRLRRGRALRDRTGTPRPPRAPPAPRLERLRLPRHVAEGPALRRLRGGLPRTIPARRSRLAAADARTRAARPRALLRPAPGPDLRPRQPALLPRGRDRVLHLLLARGRLRPRARSRRGSRWPRADASRTARPGVSSRGVRLLRDEPRLRSRRPRHRGPVAVGVARLGRQQDQALRPRRPRRVLARDRAARRLPPGRLRRRLRRGPPRPGLRERGPRGRGDASTAPCLTAWRPTSPSRSSRPRTS